MVQTKKRPAKAPASTKPKASPPEVIPPHSPKQKARARTVIRNGKPHSPPVRAASTSNLAGHLPLPSGLASSMITPPSSLPNTPPTQQNTPITVNAVGSGSLSIATAITTPPIASVAALATTSETTFSSRKQIPVAKPGGPPSGKPKKSVNAQILAFLASQSGQPVPQVDEESDAPLTAAQVAQFNAYLRRLRESLLPRVSPSQTDSSGAQRQLPETRRTTTDTVPSSSQQRTSTRGTATDPQWTVMPVEYSPSSGSFVVSGSQDQIGYGSSNNSQHVPRQGLTSAIDPMRLSRHSGYPDCSSQQRQYNRRP